MIFPPSKGASHRERLDAFYRGQADAYDDFRRRLLHGREELMGRLEFRPGDVWLDMGAGTGSNAELLGERLGVVAGRLDGELLHLLHDLGAAQLDHRR